MPRFCVTDRHLVCCPELVCLWWNSQAPDPSTVPLPYRLMAPDPSTVAGHHARARFDPAVWAVRRFLHELEAYIADGGRNRIVDSERGEDLDPMIVVVSLVAYLWCKEYGDQSDCVGELVLGITAHLNNLRRNRDQMGLVVDDLVAACNASSA